MEKLAPILEKLRGLDPKKFGPMALEVSRIFSDLDEGAS